MATEKNRNRRAPRSVVTSGNPVAAIDEILGCAHVLMCVFSDQDEKRTDAADMFHFTNQMHMTSAVFGTTEANRKQPLFEDWDKMRDLYGVAQKRDFEDRLRHLTTYAGELSRVFYKLQNDMVRFLVTSFPEDLLSRRAQAGVLHHGAKLVATPILVAAMKAFDAKYPKIRETLENNGNLLGTCLAVDPELILEAVRPEINFLELAIDYIASCNLDIDSKPEHLVADMSENLVAFRDLILKIVPRSVANDLNEAEIGIVAACDKMRERIDEESAAVERVDVVSAASIEATIKAGNLDVSPRSIRALADFDFESKSIGECVKKMLGELESAYSNGMNSATVFLCSSVMENLLMEFLMRNRTRVAEIVIAKKLDFASQNQYVKMDDFTTWRLVDILRIVKIMVIDSTPEYYNILDAFRSVRNYIHGGKNGIENIHRDLAVNAVAVCERLISQGGGAS